MILTEAEAKTKWCPFARVAAGAFPDFVTVNREASPETWPKCLGSACMAWRQKETMEFHMEAEAEFRRNNRRLACTTGFCGLAGPAA